MYGLPNGSPNQSDPYSERQELPADLVPRVRIPEPDPDSDPSAFLVCVTVVALPVFVLAFSLGYMSGVWGWI